MPSSSGISRRNVLKAMAATLPATQFFPAAFGADAPDIPPIAEGPFKGARQSLEAYRAPDWFRDAKFGIWAHWGPQSAAEAGDWYARNMYIQGSPQYRHHVKTYGHPSKFGFKDVIPTWKADRFDPDYLVGLYKKAGAKYFVSMGVHHDNFDLWNSKHQKWNAVEMGPKKDVVGLFRDAARKHDLKFGVSEHLWISYKWFAVSHLADKTGELKGVPYDGANAEWSSLYHDNAHPTQDFKWDNSNTPEAWKRQWFLRIKDLVDNYQPDLLYTDGAIPFDQWGLNLVAHHYNQNAKRHGGNCEAVYNSKRREDSAVGTCVLDVERGIVESIWPSPWQTDTCVGQWHYNRGQHYKTPETVIQMLVDIVSRNGNLLLNFPLPNSGMLDDQELAILSEITDWMKINSEAIYGTRPWKIFGDGPGTASAAAKTGFNENRRKALTAEDCRFTTKGDTLYAFFMGWPQKQVTIVPLGTNSKQQAGKIQNVELLGFGGKLEWTQNEQGLVVQVPQEPPCKHAFALKVMGA